MQDDITARMRRACDDALKWHHHKRADEEERLRELGRKLDEQHAQVSAAASSFSAYRASLLPSLNADKDADKRALLDRREEALQSFLRSHRWRPIGATKFGNIGSTRNFTSGDLPTTQTMLGFELVHHMVRECVDTECSPVFKPEEVAGFPIRRWTALADLVSGTFGLKDGDGGIEFRNRIKGWITRNSEQRSVWLRPWPN